VWLTYVPLVTFILASITVALDRESWQVCLFYVLIAASASSDMWVACTVYLVAWVLYGQLIRVVKF